jgi:hypothetical protein
MFMKIKLVIENGANLERKGLVRRSSSQLGDADGKKDEI